MVDEAKEPLDVKMNILVKVKVTSNDVDDDVFHLVVAVHPQLGSDLTNNDTRQRLMALRVPELQKSNV